jgi:hypothetical protein
MHTHTYLYIKCLHGSTDGAALHGTSTRPNGLVASLRPCAPARHITRRCFLSCCRFTPPASLKSLRCSAVSASSGRREEYLLRKRRVARPRPCCARTTHFPTLPPEPVKVLAPPASLKSLSCSAGPASGDARSHMIFSASAVSPVFALGIEALGDHPSDAPE